MVNRFVVVAVVCVLLIVGSVASAEIVKVNVDVLFSFGMFSEFDADGGAGGLGQQRIESNNGAYVWMDDSSSQYFGKTDVWSNFETVTDMSGGGTAHARFASGSYSVKLYNPGNAADVVFEMTGYVSWYNEDETQESPASAFDGRGILTIATLDIDEAYWGTEAGWGSTNGKNGVTTTISNTTPQLLQDYASDWSASNVTMTIWADSGVIPEPATVALLGLGSLLALRRKIKA